MTIETSTPNDIADIFQLYKFASEYQRSKQTVVVWPPFEQALIETEIAEGRQWKLLTDGQIACVWAITFSDAQIWQERNMDAAIYIHRIATHPRYRGRNFVKHLVAWARGYAKEHRKDFIRLDTIGNNTGLINHYANAGFAFLGIHQMQNTDGLPAHYKSGEACLFEIRL